MMLNPIEKKDCKILVVDDVPQNIQVIGNILNEQNYQVSFALSGAEALTLVERNNFDLILLDILMPGMDGFEVCRTLKSNQKTQKIPIIFLTAKADIDSMVKGFELGAVDYLTKPFKSEELLIRVKSQVTLKKQTEQLENINQILEEKVNERTAQLIKANEELAKLEHAKSKFLTLISHELRTPLNAINGFIEILYPSLQSTEHEPTMNILMNASEKLISLSETALLITELQLGEYQLNYSDVKISEITKTSINFYQSIIHEKHLQISLLVDDNARFIRSDYDLVLNSIKNIIHNAVKFAPHNGVIECKSQKEGECVKVIITNSGNGFSEDELGRIFEILAKDKMTNFYEGFGVGLAAVKLAMEVLSGKIEVKNLETGGASITLIFPQ